MAYRNRKPVGLLTAAILLVIFAPIAYFVSKNPRQAEAAWWNETWRYRNVFIINNSGSAVTSSRKIKIDVDTASLISAGKMQSNCNDVRFIDQKGKQLDYFIDTQKADCNNASTDFYVKVNSVSTGSQNIYIYYGNSSAPNVRKNDFFASDTTGIGLKGYWKMDDNVTGNGQTILDSASTNNGLTHDANASGMNCSGAGKLGSSSCTFDRVDDYISLSNLDVNTSAGAKNTVSFWMYWDGVEGKMPFGWTGYDLWTSSSCFGFNTGQSNVLGFSTTNIAINSWVHVIATFYNGVPSDTNNEIYINGVKKTLTACLGTTSASMTVTTTATIANWNSLGAYYYGGKLDDFRLYSRALTQAEATAIYNSGAGVEIPVPLTFSPSSTTSGSEETSPAPVAHWKFDEGSGTVANDSGTNKNNATIAGTSWQPKDQCVAGKCLYFNGVAGTRVSSNSTVIVNGDFTVEFWFKTGISQTKVLVGNRGGGVVNSGFVIYPSGNNIVATYSNGTSAATNINAPFNYYDNKWHHLVYKVERTSQQLNSLYIDGALISSNAGTVSGSVGSALTVGIGDYSNGGFPFQGFIDDVKIYPYARSLSQIKSGYSSKSTGQSSSDDTSATLGSDSQSSTLTDGLIGYWKMDEAAANTCSGGVNDSCDISGNNKDAAWNGSTGVTAGKYGNGTSFDGTNSYIDIPNFALGADGSYPSFTLSAWVYANSKSNQVIFGDNQNGCDGLEYTGNDICIGADNNSSTWTGARPSYSAWHHVLLVVNNSQTAELFIDSISKGIKDISGYTQYWGTGNEIITSIGKNYCSGDCWLSGSIDEVRIYNRALTTGEITSLYSFSPPPVAYYPFDEGSGTIAYDKSGNARTATLLNGASWAPGKFGSAVKLNVEANNNQYLNVSANVNHGYTFTKEAWIKPTSISGCIESRCSILNPYFEISGTSLQYYNYQLTPNGWYTGGTIRLDQWQHVAVSFDGSFLRLYINGIQVNSTASTQNGALASTGIIGAYASNSRTFKGYIDEVRVYDYARSPGQITQDMNAGHPLGGSPVGSQIGYWKMDEGYGSTTNNSGSQGTTLVGTLRNSPTWTNDGKFNKGITLDGLNDYVEIPNNSSIEYIGGDMTLSVWFKPDASDDRGQIISRPWNGSGQYNYWFYSGGGANPSLSFVVAGDSPYTLSFNQTITAGAWHQLSATVSSNKEVKLYIDGKLTNSGTHTITTWVPSSGDSHLQLAIGTLYPYGDAWAGNTTYSVKGNIDEVKYYNAVLSADEIKADYNRGSTITFGSSNQTISGTTTSLEYCIPGDTSACAAPVAEYKFEEGTGTNANDTGTSQKTLPFVASPGNPTYQAGIIGKSLYFDGNDGVGYNDGGTVAAVTGPITVNAWIKTNASTSGGIVCRYGNSGTWTFCLYMSSDGKVNFLRSSGTGPWSTTLTSTSSINNNKWHFISARFDSSTMKIYIDGVENNSVNETRVSNGALWSFCIGNQHYLCENTGYNGHFTGNIDQVRIYNYARTPAQIAWDYNRGAPVGHWKLDECQGAVANDSSGNGNSGTITIGATGTQTSTGTCQTSSTAWGNGATGKFNSSLNFDGTDDYVDISDPASDYPISVSMWIKPNTLTDSDIPIYLHLASGKWVAGGLYTSYGFITNTTNVHADAAYFSIGEWRNVVIVMTSLNTGSIYINGIDRTTSSTQHWTESGTISEISGRNHANLFAGQIDDVRIYNYALTAEQIKQVYNNGAINFGPATGTPQ